MFLLSILIPVCNLSSPAFLIMCSVYRLNKQGDSRQPCRTPFSILSQSAGRYKVLNCCFLILICFHVNYNCLALFIYSVFYVLITNSVLYSLTVSQSLSQMFRHTKQFFSFLSLKSFPRPYDLMYIIWVSFILCLLQGCHPSSSHNPRDPFTFLLCQIPCFLDPVSFFIFVSISFL